MIDSHELIQGIINGGKKKVNDLSKEIGISRATIYRMLKNKNISMKNYRIICNYFNCSEEIQTTNDQSIKVIEDSNIHNFSKKCNGLIKQGYNLHSSSCGFVNSEKYDFCSCYQAIFVKEDNKPMAIEGIYALLGTIEDRLDKVEEVTFTGLFNGNLKDIIPECFGKYVKNCPQCKLPEACERELLKRK
jgi:DNA-binding Xre family transcriptional regulator